MSEELIVLAQNLDEPDDPQKALLPENALELRRFMFAEANYDRWQNFLFPPRQTPELDKPRVSPSISVISPNGEAGEGRIEILPSYGGKCYTTRTYEVLQAITQIWEDHGKKDDPITVPLSEIARKLDLKTSGRVLNIIFNEMKSLSRTVTVWRFTFSTANEANKNVEDQKVLDTFEYLEKKDRISGLTKETKCKFRLSELIRNNLRHGVTIPINFSARKSIKSDICKAIYSRIDSEIVGKKRLENTATTIVEKYYLTPDRYKYKSQRKGLVETVKKNLDGVETSREGVYLTVSIEETADGSDWKCVYTTKGESKELKKLAKSGNRTSLAIVNSDKDFRDYLIDEIEAVVGGKDENLALYQLFALHYSENHIRRALGEFKELTDSNPGITKKHAYFTSLMHIMAHKLNKDWINHCDRNCKFRPENQLFPS